MCEGLIDNFKILYQRFASIRDNTGMQSPDVMDEAKDSFYSICNVFIDRIGEEFDCTLDEEYLNSHYEDTPSLALAMYLFFVLHLRSNLYNVLLAFISAHLKELATHFEEMRARKDSISEVNRSMEDQDVALVASNIYDVVDWIMENMDPDTFFASMEPDYVALKPIQTLYEQGALTGNFVIAMRDILKENISMKGRVCFDIICKLKGYQMT